MYLSDFIGDKGALLERAMSHPGLNPKRKPKIEDALKVTVSEVERTAMTSIADVLTPVLSDMYDMYEINNGEYEFSDREAREEWESGLDDKVEEIFEPYQMHLSADWLARNTIDTKLFEEGAIRKLAESAGREIVKQLSSVSVQELNQGVVTKTPAQVLANAGVLQTDVEVYLSQHLAAKNPEQEKEMSDQTTDSVDAVMQKMRAHLGTGFDVMAVYDDVELVFDEDDILANGAGARLGLNEDDVQTLKALEFTVGSSSPDDLPNHVMSLLDDTPEKGKKPAKAKAEAKSTEPPAMGDEASDVLTLIIDHSAVGGTKLAENLGFSRATFNNYKTGKTPFKPDEVQKGVLRGQIVQDLNGLYKALCLVDGVDVDREFE